MQEHKTKARTQAQHQQRHNPQTPKLSKINNNEVFVQQTTSKQEGKDGRQEK
jgi:hypothetical protein